MISTWTDCAGRTVGNWKLDSLLGVRDDTAYYIGTDEATGASALVHLVEADHKNVRDSWELARTLSHPNLLALYACGDTYFDLTRIDYAVTEIPDDDLGEMLSREPLTRTQADKISAQAAQALDFLHQHGLCHGAVSPSAIFVVGGTAKLTVDTLTPATEAGKARDLQQLWEIFPVQPPEPEPVRASLPVPEEHAVPRARLPWAVIGVAGGAVLALLVGYRSYNSNPAPVAQQAPRQVVATPAPAAAQTQKPSPVVQTRSRETGYAVVAATYSSYVSADSRAKKLNQQSRKLRAHVVPPDGQGSLYYVVFGTGLSQKEAERLKRTAREAGAPHDTYVTKMR